MQKNDLQIEMGYVKFMELHKSIHDLLFSISLTADGLEHVLFNEAYNAFRLVNDLLTDTYKKG